MQGSAGQRSHVRNEQEPSDMGKKVRRTYASPRLTAYGSVKELTKGSGGSQIDGHHPHKF